MTVWHGRRARDSNAPMSTGGVENTRQSPGGAGHQPDGADAILIGVIQRDKRVISGIHGRAAGHERMSQRRSAVVGHRGVAGTLGTPMSVAAVADDVAVDAIEDGCGNGRVANEIHVWPGRDGRARYSISSRRAAAVEAGRRLMDRPAGSS